MAYQTPQLLLVGAAQNLVLADKYSGQPNPQDCIRDTVVGDLPSLSLGLW
jgi:hypothetical protein